MRTRLSFRRALRLAQLLLFTLALMPFAAFPQSTTRQPANTLIKRGDAYLVLAINEGATTQTPLIELVERYTPLAKTIERTLGRPVRIEVFPEIPRFRAELEKERFDLIFGKTVNVLAVAVRDKGFQALVKTKAPYVAGFITVKGSVVQKPGDLRGKVIMMPTGVFTTTLGHATLRDLGILETDVTIRYTRLQEAVAHAVENGMVDVGVVNPTVKKQWEAKGYPILLETKPVPNWSIIASSRLSLADLERLRGTFVDLKSSPEGQQTLKVMNVPEFVPATNTEFVDLLKFIQE